MKTFLFAISALTISLSSVQARESFQFYSPETAAALTKNEHQQTWISEEGNFRQSYIDHDHPTKPEMHEHFVDRLIILGGGATLLMGGTISGAKETGPGEWHAEGSTDSKTYPLVPGTVVTIPVNVWHHFDIPNGGHLLFTLIKHQES